jgi:hypothetical protein
MQTAIPSRFQPGFANPHRNQPSIGEAEPPKYVYKAYGCQIRPVAKVNIIFMTCVGVGLFFFHTLMG